MGGGAMMMSSLSSSGRDSTVLITAAVAFTLSLSWLGIACIVRENRRLRKRLEERANRFDESNESPVTATINKSSGDHKNPTTAQNGNTNNELPVKHESDLRSITLQEIGYIESPFPQRAGCPRQGTLAPHVASRLVLHPHMPRELLDGISLYSHVWILSLFHLNPRGKARTTSSSTCSTNHHTFTAAKVRPPRAGGIRVGVLATRAPHRPNPIGLSLAMVERVMTIHTATNHAQTCLVLRGLDLVDGTPVVDVKPYVPSDRVAYDAAAGGSMETHDGMDCDSLLYKMQHLQVPSWVASRGDELASVQWIHDSERDLSSSLYAQSDLLAPLYSSAADAKKAISEIVAQDPRALHDGRGTVTAGEDDYGAAPFEFTFGGLRVAFEVRHGGVAMITRIMVDEGDMTASVGSYPHSVALRRKAEKEAGKKLAWARPIREGVTEGILDLRHGGEWQFDS